MMLPPNPSTRADKTHAMFWELVTLTRTGDQDATDLAAQQLAKYLENHGGYKRLADSLEYLATSVAINSIVGGLPEQQREALAKYHCPDCGANLRLTPRKTRWCPQCNVELKG